ncbi:MAG: hypothetical protein M1818_005317 [Claussenomyces sp. TS43310]|nr:MAG: hypothetical protein M1818_005317 [Claussenomyces sp. TS43310]
MARARRSNPRHDGDNNVRYGLRRRKQNTPGSSCITPTRSTRAHPQLMLDDGLHYENLPPTPPVTPQKGSPDSILVSDCHVMAEGRPNIKHLPPEIIQEIAKYLPDDQDAVAYAQLCKVTWAWMNDSEYRRRFLVLYDDIEGSDRVQLAKQYKARAKIARQYVRFDQGLENGQAACLVFLRTLIIESNGQKIVAADGSSTVIGRNFEFMNEYANRADRIGQSGGTNILDAMCRTESLFRSAKHSRSSGKTASLPLLIQLCLLHVSLDPHPGSPLSGAQQRARMSRLHHCHEAQEQVYKCFSHEPIFLGGSRNEINVIWLLHVANFFKFHLLKDDSEGIYADGYINMEKGNLPRAWTGRLKNGAQQLSKRWKGTYCYLPEWELQVARSKSCDFLVDVTGDDNDGFQDLTLFFDIQKHPRLHFPAQAETILHGKPRAPFTDPESGERKWPEVQDFFGLGFDGRHYHFNGRMHTLPPQQAIPGFQRVSMMMYLPQSQGPHANPSTQLWAYEGLVLPGGQLMLGRWWSPVRGVLADGGTYCGPFIFWAVDDAGLEDRSIATVDAALQFLDSVISSPAW